MHDAEGVGLAATQVGIVRRFFVCTLDGEDRVLVNPVVTPVGKDTEVDGEGCLSLGSVRVPVERAAKVKVEAQDAEGAPVALELEGYPARVVQHEVDHLDGKLMLDRTDAEARREALGKLRPASSLLGLAMPQSWLVSGAARRSDRRSPRPRRSAPERRSEAALARTRHDVARCSLTRARRASAGRPAAAERLAAPPAKEVAERLGIPVLQPERPDAGLDLGAPTVVVCAYGLLIPPALLAERTWLNVHPSLLPAGAAPRRSSGRSWPGTRKRV